MGDWVKGLLSLSDMVLSRRGLGFLTLLSKRFCFEATPGLERIKFSPKIP